MEFGNQVALEVVLDDEDAEEVGVAASAEDVPGQGSEAEGSDSGRMKEAERVAPALRKECPKEDRPAAENDAGRPLRQHRKSKEKSKQNWSEPSSMCDESSIEKGRSMLRPFLARSLRYEANDYCGADHGDG